MLAKTPIHKTNSLHIVPIDYRVLFRTWLRMAFASWIKQLPRNETNGNRSMLRYTTAVGTDSIRPGFTGTVPAFWVSKSSLTRCLAKFDSRRQVSRFFFSSHKYRISASAYEHFGFPTVGGNICTKEWVGDRKFWIVGTETAQCEERIC